ncbi:MAG: hypothetical protein IPJ61_21230 [Tessaracoccus sp.]|uniref:hypothetical protein n=1 Tax=Tessaracoccus sp. TaxID=1971211 RepID=UPI001EC657A6|nr:hypothetical protein [Tessaracoccus sp.]MBK7823512.1 hypothetical protein [Tessaracoccus sp.]
MTARIEATDLVITIVEELECEIVEVERMRTYRDTVRTEGYPNGLLYEAGIMLVAGAMSWRLQTDPEGACTKTNDDGTMTMSDPETCRTLGQILGVGAGVVGVALALDLYSLRDSTDDLGVRKSESVVGREACGQAPVSDQEVAIKLPTRAKALAAHTNSGGIARVSLRDVTADELDRLDGGVDVVVGVRRTWVDLDLNDVTTLRDQLTMRPDSRYAVEMAEQSEHQRVARDEARGWLQAGQLAVLRRAMRTQPPYAAAVRGEPDLIALVEEFLSTTAATLLLENPDESATLERYCDARWLLIELAGSDRWTELRAEIASRASAVSDDHTEEAFAAALNTTACP